MSQYRIFKQEEEEVKPKAYFRLEVDDLGLKLCLVDSKGELVKILLRITTAGVLRRVALGRPRGYDLDDMLQFDENDRIKMEE
jgi:hypothetical protein